MEDGGIEDQSSLHPKEEQQNYGKDGDVKKEHRGNGEDGSSSTGLINHVLTSSVSPKEVHEEKEDNKGGEDKEKKSDVLLDHLISSLVSPRTTGNANKDRGYVFRDRGGEENNGGKEEKMVQIDAENGRVKTDEEEGRSGGGIIDNIVSHLPISLSDDAADEASILIHSIIHD